MRGDGYTRAPNVVNVGSFRTKGHLSYYNTPNDLIYTNKLANPTHGHGGGVDIFAMDDGVMAHHPEQPSSHRVTNPGFFPSSSYVQSSTSGGLSVAVGASPYSVFPDTSVGWITSPLSQSLKSAYRFGGGGTSYASPTVAGLACVYMQLNPKAKAIDFKKWLRFHGTPLSITGSETGSNIISTAIYKTLDYLYEYYVNSGSSFANNLTKASDRGAIHGAVSKSLYNPYNSPFKTNKRATFRKK